MKTFQLERHTETQKTARNQKCFTSHQAAKERQSSGSESLDVFLTAERKSVSEQSFAKYSSHYITIILSLQRDLSQFH